MYQESRFWNRYGIGIAVMGGINMAMYDLLGKLLDLPVYQLLGGLVRSRIRVYASNGLYTTAEPLIADAKRAQARGFDAYKLRVTDPRTVGPLVRALREALGRDMDIMVDAGEAGGAVPWSVSISQKIAKELEPLEPLWLEEPVRVENIEGYVEMRQATTVNIAGAESLPPPTRSCHTSRAAPSMSSSSTSRPRGLRRARESPAWPRSTRSLWPSTRGAPW